MVKRFKEVTSVNLYPERPNFKWIVLILSFTIGVGSIVYTNDLVKKIRERERKQIDLYARTLEYVANDQDDPNVAFMLEEIIQANKTIPVILTDQHGNPEDFKNLPKVNDFDTPKERRAYLLKEVEEMKELREPIVLTLLDSEDQIYGYKFIYYKNSSLLTELRFYPYVQLSVIAIFVFIAFVVFNYSRSAEQNRVWVGLAKETAHQLGTPLSSLMAWVEYFRATYPDQEEVINELNKDIERLERITERFSSIGSVPQLKEENVYNLVQEVVKYLEKRLSTKVSITVTVFPDDDISANINHALFAWVIENLLKNAVDSMEGKGQIFIKILKVNEGRVAIDVTDTGKGIPKNRINQIFTPGFTTKKRGWGLGLTLTKRIIEHYHKGKIYIKETEVGKGTTFRILLRS
ncbi:MAG: HAMP domain-containing histidine kinase [Cyclobacteriaceae bacterium]|nr:HAMP domain-containing histidine kinase [Cyclobacteriaceae bacterium SS2]